MRLTWVTGGRSDCKEMTRSIRCNMDEWMNMYDSAVITYWTFKDIKTYGDFFSGFFSGFFKFRWTFAHVYVHGLRPLLSDIFNTKLVYRIEECVQIVKVNFHWVWSQCNRVNEWLSSTKFHTCISISPAVYTMCVSVNVCTCGCGQHRFVPVSMVQRFFWM